MSLNTLGRKLVFSLDIAEHLTTEIIRHQHGALILASGQSPENPKRQVALALCLVPGKSRDMPIRKGLHSRDFDAQLRQAISPQRLPARIASPLGTGCKCREAIATV